MYGFISITEKNLIKTFVLQSLSSTNIFSYQKNQKIFGWNKKKL